MAKDSRTPQQVSEDLHAQLEHLTAALQQGDRILSCSGEHRQQVVFVETT